MVTNSAIQTRCPIVVLETVKRVAEEVAFFSYNLDHHCRYGHHGHHGHHGPHGYHGYQGHHGHQGPSICKQKQVVLLCKPTFNFLL